MSIAEVIVLDDERMRRKLVLVDADGAPVRPRTRGDCVDGPRPCPWVGCRHNTFLDVSAKSGALTLNHGLEPDEVDPRLSCALDVAERGGAGVELIGGAMGFTRERARQIEEKALRKIQRRPGELEEWDDGDGDATVRGNKISRSASSRLEPVERHDPAEDPPDDDAPTRVSFFGDVGNSPESIRDVLRARDANDDEAPYWRDVPGFVPEADDAEALPTASRVDELVCASVWNMFAKDSNARGFDCRSKGSRAAPRSLARTRAAKGETARVKPPQLEQEEERPAMNGTTNGAAALSQKQKNTLTTYNALKKELRRVPMATEVADKLGIGVAAARYQIGQLADMGLAETAPRGGVRRGVDTPKTEVKTEAATAASAVRGAVRNALQSIAPKPLRTTSADPVVAALIEKRDAFLTRAEALDVAIEALSVAL